MSNTNRYEVIAPMPYFTHLLKGDILVPKHHALCGDCWGREDEEDVQKWVTFCPDYLTYLNYLTNAPKHTNNNCATTALCGVSCNWYLLFDAD